MAEAAITRKTVDHVARLARLGLSEAERERMVQELGAILDYVGQLQAVDVEAASALFQVLPQAEAVLRADRQRSGLGREEALAEAPDHTGEYFRVPSIGEDF